MRGGTSNAVVFKLDDLPRDRALWDEIFLAAIGSPDAYGRQLDGMGGGLSSLSKVCVVGAPSRPDADVDYTFGQVQVKEASVDYTSLCGNMSAAIGPFAVDEGLVKVSGREALVRIHNTNTSKIVWSHFTVDDGQAAVDGDMTIPGVAGSGSPVRLEFREPGGASTSKLLPTGNVVDTLEVPGYGKIKVSMVDAGNATTFVHASDLGLKGTEMPEELERNTEALKHLAAIRVTASVAMGFAKSLEEAARKHTVPFVGFVSGPQDGSSLSGEKIQGSAVDLTARMISNGQPHRALQLTTALCTAVAARITGTVVHQVTRPSNDPEADIRLAMPSGILNVATTVRQSATGQWHAEQAAFYRTQRRLFEGNVCMRASRVPGLAALVAGSPKQSGWR
jgi:2-methylaconitate cis-trans-isomerase PrpF